MTTPAALRGQIFPAFTLPGMGQSAVILEDYRGRTNLVLVLAGEELVHSPVSELLEELTARAQTLKAELAQVIVVAASADLPCGQGAFPVALDEDASVHRQAGATDAAGRPAPAVFVTDRFREIYGAYFPGHGSTLPSAQEIIEWLVFINIQCPECGAPEWPR
jgi:hypothetical protein